MALHYPQHMNRGRPTPLTINTGQTSHDQRRLAQQQRAGRRFSWGQTPIEMQDPVFGPNGTHGQKTMKFEPVEQPIAQSPMGVEERGLDRREGQHGGNDARGHVERLHKPMDYSEETKKDNLHPAHRTPILPNTEESIVPRRTVVWPASYIDPALISGGAQQGRQAAQPTSARATTQPYSPDAIGTPPPVIRTGTFASLSDPSSHPEEFRASPPTRISTLPHLPGQIPHPNMTLPRTATAATTATLVPGPPPPPPQHYPSKRASADAKPTWSTSLLALCGPALSAPDTLLALCLPCALDSRTAHRLDARSAGRDPTNLLSFATPNPRCLASAACAPCGLPCLLPCVNRVRIRRRYGIEGGLGGDCVAAACCCCCVVAQNEREVKVREEARRERMGPSGAGGGGGGVREEMVYRPGG